MVLLVASRIEYKLYNHKTTSNMSPSVVFKKSRAHSNQPRIQDLAKGGGGGAILREGRHIDNECMLSQGRIRKAGGGGGGGGVLSDAKSGGERRVLSASDPIRKVGGGGGGGGGLLAVRRFISWFVRDSAWGVERGEGGGAAIGPKGRHFI